MYIRTFFPLLGLAVSLINFSCNHKKKKPAPIIVQVPSSMDEVDGDASPIENPDSPHREDAEQEGMPNTTNPTSGGFSIKHGVKDHEQIYYTMALLTEVDVTSYRSSNRTERLDNGRISEVRSAYDKTNALLPSTSNNFADFTASNQSMVYNLAINFCDAMLELSVLEEKRRRMFGDTFLKVNTFGTDLAPLEAFTGPSGDENKLTVARGLIREFWSGLASEEEMLAGEQTLATLMAKLTESSKAVPSLSTRNIVKAACGAALASLPIIML